MGTDDTRTMTVDDDEDGQIHGQSLARPAARRAFC